MRPRWWEENGRRAVHIKWQPVGREHTHTHHAICMSHPMTQRRKASRKADDSITQSELIITNTQREERWVNNAALDKKAKRQRNQHSILHHRTSRGRKKEKTSLRTSITCAVIKQQGNELRPWAGRRLASHSVAPADDVHGRAAHLIRLHGLDMPYGNRSITAVKNWPFGAPKITISIIQIPVRNR